MTRHERQNQASPPAPRNGNAEMLANALGWFSICLGISEVAAPGAVSKLAGIEQGDGKHSFIRLCGLREVATGLGILTHSSRAGWLWGRVAGDLMDLALLGTMKSAQTDRTRASISTAAVLGVTALDLYCGIKLSRSLSWPGRVCAAETTIINRSPADVYSFWHDFGNFPRLMDQLESVRVAGENRYQWKVKTPIGTIIEWESEILSDQRDSLIAWRSIGGDFDNSGSVRFERATGGRGTLVTVELEYTLPAGVIGSTIAKLFGAEPAQQVSSALRRMKQILETGDIVRSESSIHTVMHPARPSEHTETGLSGTSRLEPWKESSANRSL